VPPDSVAYERKTTAVAEVLVDLISVTADVEPEDMFKAIGRVPDSLEVKLVPSIRIVPSPEFKVDPVTMATPMTKFELLVVVVPRIVKDPPAL
jgi:hypothetical protein